MPFQYKSGLIGGTVFSIALMLSAGTSPGGTSAAASQNYSLEYVSTAAYGTAVSVAGYSILSQVQTTGVAGRSVSSQSYSITPLIGVASTQQTRVAGWFLY